MTNLQTKTPTTLREAIEILAAGVTETERKFINGNEAARLHHFAGMALRNDWKLWNRDSPIVKDIKKRYGLFGHGDDCSGLILAGLWTKVKGGDVEKSLQAEVKRYIAHWKRSGVNPATGEPIKGFDKIRGKTTNLVVLDDFSR